MAAFLLGVAASVSRVLKGTLVHQLWDVLREDWQVHGSKWTNPGFHAVAVHRFGRWARQQSSLLRLITVAFHQIIYVLVRNVYGIEVPVNTELGRRVRISHQSGIVISDEAIIGDECVLRQNTTISATMAGLRTNGRRAPTLGNGVVVGAGAVIAGGITIGDRAEIGARAVVLTDVPAGATALAQPARVMRLPGTQPRRTGEADG